MNSISNNRRIAKNTIYIYIRTIVVLIVSLYTSRVVLSILGVDDYGIYNVVAGIITLMAFFQTAQSKATSRFITYELGINGIGKSLQHVFSVSITIHIFAIIIAIVIFESIGIYIITHWTNIPANRQFATNIIYQLSIIIFCIQLLRIPYDSVIIAHEDMSMFAYFSVIEAFLQLLLVVVLKNIHADYLICYVAMMLLSALILFALYFFYVKWKYPIYLFRFTWDKSISKRMLSFSGWTLMGTSANACTQQGVNLMLNNFVGLVANAAIGISAQVNVAISKFVSGFSTAFTPQIIKLYAQRKFSDLNLLVCRASKFSFTLCYIFALPLLCNMHFCLNLWLGDNVPQFAADFCCMILICTIIDALTGVYNIVITATGNIKWYQLYISISFCLDLCISAILLAYGLNPTFVFLSRIITRGILNMLIGLYFIKKYIDFDILSYFKLEIANIIITIALTAIPSYIICMYMNGWIRIFASISYSFASILLCVLYIIMTKQERHTFIKIVKAKFKNNDTT